MIDSHTPPPVHDSPSGAALALMSKVTVDRVESPVFQLAEKFRAMIRNGELQPGMRLPSTRDLAGQLSVDPMAVHRALAKLTKEGLLVRTLRVGTFVATPPGKLERLAYYHRNVVPGHFGPFDRAVVTELVAIGQEKGFGVEVINDTRPPEESERKPHPELLRHARSRWVQGVISDVPPEHVAWFRSLPVPHATISNLSQPDTFNWSREENAALAIRQLAKRGCRKIGAIAPLLLHEADGADGYQLGLYRGMRDTLAELGLPFNPAWSVGRPSLDVEIREPDIPAFAYQAIHRIWSQPDRPDGLLVYPDIAGHGVFVALAMHQVKVPEDLQLVMHANAEIPVFCPFPTDRLVVRAADAAKAMVDHICRQLDGRQTTRRLLPVHIEPHDQKRGAPFKSGPRKKAPPSP